MTRPFLMVEYLCVILPVAQCARLILRLAVRSVLPFSLGTMQLGLRANDAVADRSFFMVTVQAPLPEHAPVQPLKVDPFAGSAVSLTVVPWGYALEQVLPHLTPAGLEVMLPFPVPVLVTLSVSGVGEEFRVRWSGTARAPCPGTGATPKCR